MNILITGANGFVGKQLQPLLEEQGHQLLLATRNARQHAHTTLAIGNIDTFDEWDDCLSGVDVIIHLAARVHQMDDEDKELYQRTNVDATTRLAEAAIRCGVKRFIFLSTIKVNGEDTSDGLPFSAADLPAPIGAYGNSKFQAEEALKALLDDREMALVVIRPPLVYGPGVKANFLRLVSLANSGVMLPFAGIHNHRDMVSANNLCDLIATCVDHPRAAGKTFLISDGIPYSTADIIRSVRLVAGFPERLFYCPPVWLKWLLTLSGKKDVSDRLFGSLEIDISDTVETLSWTPKYTLEHTLRQMLS
ncbi:MAG: NAD-dependent epimerase/dehydratase family protein [Oceanicoccus sp.]